MTYLGSLSELSGVEGVRIALVLVLSVLVGLEREEHKSHSEHYTFGGARTFPLLGLLGYALARLAGASSLLLAVGLVVVGAFMLTSYRHKLHSVQSAGLTTEISGLVTFAMGALVHHGMLWLAATLAIVTVLLLEVGVALQKLAVVVAPGEIVTVAKFLLLSVVILPLVPDRELGSFALNPFQIWLVVVAMSGVSYGSYALQRWIGVRGGVLLGALLGGAYSSTATTVALARRARNEPAPHAYAGSILAACGVMYARLVLLVAFFDARLAARLAPSFLLLAIAACVAGWLVTRRAETAPERRPQPAKNPLEIRTALLFALAFAAIVVVTRLAAHHAGPGWLIGLAGVMGVADVDPFVLSVAQAPPGTASHELGGVLIVVAASSNNVAKAVYARVLADRETGLRALVLLLGLAVAGLLPLLALRAA